MRIVQAPGDRRAQRAPYPLVALLAFVAALPAAEGQEEFRETYEAFAVAMGTSNPPVLPPGVSTTLQINVTRWTSDE